MANNPSDFRFAIAKETVANTTPSSAGYLVVPHADGTEIMLNSNVVTSPSVVANRASRGQRKTEYSAGGTISAQLQRSAVFDLLFESALSGTFATNVLKAGNTDTSLTVEKTMYPTGGTIYHRATGVQVSSMSLNITTGGSADVTFDLIGMDRITGTTTSTGTPTYTLPSSTLPLVGLDTAVTIGGYTADALSLNLTVSHNREAQQKLGSAYARGIGTSGIREVKLVGQFYREDLTPDTLFAKSDATVAVSFDVGATTNGYRFAGAAANVSVPQDSADASKSIVTIEFTMAYDATALTDFSITKLT